MFCHFNAKYFEIIYYFFRKEIRFQAPNENCYRLFDVFD